MASVLGGLNYDAVLSAEDYRTYRNLIEKEILDRFLLSAGAPPYSAPLTGIVDNLDPASISSSETTRPLLVTVSNINSLNILVNPGTAVTPSGALVTSTGSFSFSLARTQDNDINIVFLENEIIQGGNNTLNDYMENLYAQEKQNSDNLRSVLIQDWNNVSLFPPERKNNIVVIAVVSVIPTAGAGQELQVDMTRSVYSFNRPWFSVMDIRHRASIGSGTVTDQNPHGISFNDLSTSSNVGLFQGLSNSGQVVSRDRNISKMTGAVYCVEDIPLNRLEIDTTGTVTANSVYGKINAVYCKLLAFPTRIGSVYEQGKPANSISAEIIEGTNILVFGPRESLNKPLVVEYTKANALLPPVSYQTNLITFGTPVTDEAVVAGGKTFGSTGIPDPTVDLEGSGPFPKRYSAYLLESGSLQVYPQTIVPAVRLDLLGSDLYAPVVPMQYAARIRFGLTKANVVSGMQVSVVLYGKDITGSSISETLSLSTAAGYFDEVTPSFNYDAPAQSVVSSNIFSRLDNIQVTTRDNDGPLSVLQLWAEIEPGTTPELNDAMKIADIYWDGHGVKNVIDCRKVNKGYAQEYETPMPSVYGFKVFNTQDRYYKILLNDNFEDLKSFDSFRGFYGAISATGAITVQNNSLLRNGDTILIKPSLNGNPSKTLTAVTAATAVTSIGQFKIGTDEASTKANLIATINDATFNSGVLASSGTGNTINLVLTGTSEKNGAIGNSLQITTTLTNQLALSISGYSLGYDPIGECYLDRSVKGIKSLKLPDSSNLTPSGYDFRGRYRSRAIALPDVSPLNIYIVPQEEDIFYPSSLRIRYSNATRPTEWEPWIVVRQGIVGNQNSSLIYPLLTATGKHKIQIEYYGRAKGIALIRLTD